MYRRITTLLSPLLLATLALPAFAAPQAFAAPPHAVAITTHQLHPKTQQDDYTRGFRDGYRQGHDDGETDGRLDCQMTRPGPKQVPQVVTDYQRGFSEGYPQGYESGHARICGGSK
jgi:flagellar biosynthesis/type III secretory pathway protein FliH